MTKYAQDNTKNEGKWRYVNVGFAHMVLNFVLIIKAKVKKVK